MTLIVEDGTNVIGAESYATVAQFDTYHANRGNTLAATLITAEKEQALRRATDYMEQVYRNQWAGYREFTDQVLSWPRTYVPVKDSLFQGYNFYGAGSVPDGVINACIELAFRAAGGTMLSDTTQKKLSTTVGEISVTYDKFSPNTTQYNAIDALLLPYLSGNGISHKLVR